MRVGGDALRRGVVRPPKSPADSAAESWGKVLDRGGGYSGILSLTARECDARHGPGVCRDQQATSLPVYALCAEL